MAISVLVTGGTGFLGSHIIDAIQEKHPGWTITVFDLKSPTEAKANVHYIQGDIVKAVDVEDAIASANPRVITHSASLVPPSQHRYTRKLEKAVLCVNVEGTQNLLTSAKDHNVSTFVYTSSCTTVIDDTRRQYRNIDETYPTSLQSLVYGESKARAEAFVLSANDPSNHFSTCALRASVLFGPGDPQLIPSLHSCIAKGQTPFILGDGNNMWDVSYAPNIADAHVLAVENLLATKTAAGEVFFIQNCEPVAFRDFCLEVWKQLGHSPLYDIRVPMRLAWVVGWIAEGIGWLMGKAVTLSRGSVMDACATRYASGEKARRVLGYEARIGIEEGLRITCEKYAKQLKEQQVR